MNKSYIYVIKNENKLEISTGLNYVNIPGQEQFITDISNIVFHSAIITYWR